MSVKMPKATHSLIMSPTITFASCLDKCGLARKRFLRAAQRYSLIDGNQRAAAFAYYAFFSLFPLILLFVTAGSLFVSRDRATREVIAYVENYVPLGPQMERNVFGAISGAVKTRGKLGAAASIVLFWGALRFFSALIRAVNRAWGSEVHNWWRMPLKSSLLLAVMASALLFSIGLAVLAEIARHWFSPGTAGTAWFYRTAGFMLSLLGLFYGLSLFYMLAPRPFTRFSEVWPAALLTSLLLRTLESLFVIYLRNFARFNVIYGALGGIMALLMWIYLSGCLVVFGACLCAGGVEAAEEAPTTKKEAKHPSRDSVD